MSAEPHPLPVPALSVQHLSVAYHEQPVLWDVSWASPPAGLVAIVGPNGAGKSTLLKAVFDLVPRLSGEVRIFGRPLAEARRRVGYLPQRASVDWDFPATALQVAAMGRYPCAGWFRPLPRAERERARAALAEVDMADLAARQIGQLSGGQQQRVFLARALALEADLYLMDEPFAGVDAATERAIVEVLQRLTREGRTVIAVHHDLATAPQYFAHVLLLNVRAIAAGPMAITFTPENLARTYGGRLSLLEQAVAAAQGGRAGL
ncbi:manganese ABC transporter ATP-binding protein [Siccirubricoccus deserti]|uniref:Metal ABC transporter ATP-binding protein n=1 Tax=Siccirubricoccus deserti TaxID=2013562 RepID=A0A9X0R554_9PROT|nr:metal ABC transporter ATP-binding protein [Siccirubricoccus deserti]MBC4018572.1 metal ABC transporter ATP-binding protein [Siccirubricoccus deserti]GGC67046.1 manganese ABC transporter ATP-binding protein [Siccirubricoccus deserti]